MEPILRDGPEHSLWKAPPLPDGSADGCVEVREILPPSGEAQLRFTNGSVRPVRMEPGDALLGGEREYVLALELCLPAGSVLQAPVRTVCRAE